jgi:hypothetical protein
VYGVVQGAAQGNAVGVLAGGLEAAAGAAAGIGVASGGGGVYSTVSQALSGAAAATSFGQSVAQGDVEGGLLNSLGPWLANLAAQSVANGLNKPQPATPPSAGVTQSIDTAFLEMENGVPASDGSDIQLVKTPNTGDPNTWYVNPGSGQMRLFGPDGNPAVDIDFDHDHGAGVPHFHVWTQGGRSLPIPMNPDW